MRFIVMPLKGAFVVVDNERQVAVAPHAHEESAHIDAQTRNLKEETA